MQTLSVWKGLEFVIWERVKFLQIWTSLKFCHLPDDEVQEHVKIQTELIFQNKIMYGSINDGTCLSEGRMNYEKKERKWYLPALFLVFFSNASN